MSRRVLLLGVAGVFVGIAAESSAYRWSDVTHWIPDLLVGWTFIVCGLVAGSVRPQSATGHLMVVSGFTWFLGNFASQEGMIGWLGLHGLYLYRGPFIQCVLSFPTGTLSSRLDRVTVAVGYVAAVITPIAGSEMATIALAALVIAVAARSYLKAIGPARRARAPVLRAATVVGVALAGGAIAHLVLPANANDLVLFLYEVALVGIAIDLLTNLLRAPWERAAVTDLVIGLAETPTATLRDALAHALGDPTIEVGYVIPGSEGYVDARGRLIEIPQIGKGRAVTPIELEGRRLGVLVHDPAVLDDPGLLESIASAARLAASNARLQVEVRAQVAEVRASRRRLVEAGDEERRRLERRLREGAERRLNAIGTRLAEARVLAERPGAGGTLELVVEQVYRQLRRGLDDLHELARGLHPVALQESGLAGALSDLAARSPVSIEVSVSVGDLPAEVEAEVYFVCSEALANIAKHARASSGSVSVTCRNDWLVVEISDDGVGGATAGVGWGPRGLTDRVEALGGRLQVDSPEGGGTRLTAEISLGSETHQPADPVVTRS
jgi:signal transduction histidine kinase